MVGRALVGVSHDMIMHVLIGRSVRGRMNMHHAELEFGVSQARRHRMRTWQGRRKAWGQHAKQLNDGDETSRPQSFRSAQMHQHLSYAFGRSRTCHARITGSADAAKLEPTCLLIVPSDL